VACVTNHEALEKKKRTHSGSGGSGVSAGGARGHLGGSGGDLVNSGGRPDDEPPGDSVLTIVNGVVDAPRVVLCLAKVDTDGNLTPLGSPLTDEPFEYGQSLALREIADIDVATEGLSPIVIAGDLALIADLDCAAAIDRARAEEALNDSTNGNLGTGGSAGDSSGPNVPIAAGAGGTASEGGNASEGGATNQGGANASEGGSAGAADAAPPAKRSVLRVRALPAISAGTLNAGRSLVYVANGCLGGAGYDGPAAAQYCGAGYAPREPSVSAVLVSLSRQVAPNYVALQAVNASLANPQVELRARPLLPPDDTGVAIASVLLGQAAPRPASTQYGLSDLGFTRKYQVAVETQGGNPLFSQTWASVLANGGLSKLETGRGYALIVNGPRGDLSAVSDLWNAGTVTAIAVDPE